MRRKSYIDHQLLASQFEVGDAVRLVHPAKGTQTHYLGRVTDVLDAIGFLDVEFPHGNLRVDPVDVVPVNLEPPQVDTGLDTWERRKGSVEGISAAYQYRLADLARIASGLRIAGIDPLDTYDLMYQRYSRTHSDSEIKGIVSAAYTKSAMYWKQKGRQYRPTQNELNSGCFQCPRCSTELEQAIYKKWEKLYACPDCLFLIKPADILDSLDEEEKEEVRQRLDWTDSSKAFNEWL